MAFARLECGRFPPEGGDAAGIDAAGQMTDAMLHEVSRIEHITSLKLGGSRSVTDAGVRYLSQIVTAATPRPEWHRYHGSADLRSCGRSRAGDGLVGLDEGHGRRGRALSGCERLSNVNLQGTASGDGALRALAGKALCVN